ncbi:MAG: phosphonate ABC transporter, permease protein PhnE [Acidobacteriota bacterium]
MSESTTAASSGTGTAGSNSPIPPSRGMGPWVGFGLAALFAWAALTLDVPQDRLLDLPERLARLGGLMFPPDAEYGRESVLPAMLESIQMAWLGTLIGAVLSLPLGLLGARNLFPALGVPIKALLGLIRVVPELLLAIYLVPVVGLGAFAGTLAIGLHSVGMLGKLSNDIVESMDLSPLEAVTACGGGTLENLRYAVMPQVLPEILALWLFRFEINLRASAVLGVVGAGGIGAVLLNNLSYRRFDKAGAVVVVIVVAVLAIDALSGALRKRLVQS